MTPDQLVAAIALFPAAVATLFALFVTVGAWKWVAEANTKREEREQGEALLCAAIMTTASSGLIALAALLVLRILERI